MLRLAAANRPLPSHFHLSCRKWIVSVACTQKQTPAQTRFNSTSTTKTNTVNVLGTDYEKDNFTNVTPAILRKLDARLTETPSHPLTTLRNLIESHFPSYAHFTGSSTGKNSFSPLVTPKQNFDDLSFPADHPGRAQTDSYYINRDLMLRTHTSTHEVEVFAAGHKKWLLTADVFRRDEIDRSHYPVFHQMEGARLFSQKNAKKSTKELDEENEALLGQIKSESIILEDKTVVDDGNPYQLTHDIPLANAVTLNLKYTLSLLLYKLFSNAVAPNVGAGKKEPLQIRWISAYFPFTSPSYEVEVFFGGKWMEILGCGVVQQQTLTNAKITDEIGWAFGLGLERIAMILFQIPDIRLFWSKDARFLSQFKPGQIAPFKPFSRYPGTSRDISFWLPYVASSEGARFHPNDFCDLVREVAGDLVEEVTLFDRYIPPQRQRASGDFRKESNSYRVEFRSMERNLENVEVNLMMDIIKDRAKKEFGVVLR